MNKRVLRLLLVLSTVLTAIIISLPVYANSNLTVSEIEALVVNFFCDNSGLDGNFVIFDSETTKTEEEYLFFVRYQGNSNANTLHAMATVKMNTGEMFVNGKYVCNLWTSSGTQNDKYKNILNGNFTAVAGTYKNAYGEKIELHENGLDEWRLNNNYFEYKIEGIWEKNGSYQWLIVPYDTHDKDVAFEGYIMIIYPENVEVKTVGGEIIQSDTSKVRLWCGKGDVYDNQRIYYKQDTVPEKEIKVVLNGEDIEFDQPPIMISDRVMVPIRSIFEAMGYTVEWNASTQTAEAIKSNGNITVQINNNIIEYSINGVSGIYECDVVPQIVSQRIVVPVRAVAESAGCDVQWDEENTTVIITYD